jgi:hypothetical protein
MTVALVQWKAISASGTTFSFDSAVTAGNLLIALHGNRDELGLGPIPDPPPTGWTQTPAPGGVANPAWFVAESGNYGHGALWYRAAQSGDGTGPWTKDNSAAMVIAEFSGVGTTAIDAAKAQLDSSNPGTSFSFASGAPGMAALVVCGIQTRLTTGDLVATGSTHRIPPTGSLPTTSVNHDNPALFWGETTSAAFTFTGTFSGSSLGTGYPRGARTAAFEALGLTPVAGVFIDWDDDGFEIGSHDAIHAEPGNRVISWVINRGASAEITGGAQPGSATVVLKNPSDVYNPRNASGPLYGKLRDGLPIWIGPNSNGVLTGTDPRGLFGGRVTDITLQPVAGAAVSPTVEFQCEDALGWYQRTPVKIDYDEGRQHDALRLAALVAGGETRYDLAHEIHTMPLSHADGDLRSVLDNISAVNGTRHLAKPEDLYTDWYTYTTRNRQWRLGGTADASVNAGSQHVTDTSGWRLSADTVINQQKATVTPVIFTLGTFTVWESDVLPLGLTASAPYSRIVDFDDVVRDPVLDLAYTGSAVISTFTPFAAAAKIELTTAGTSTINGLSVEGRLARRLPTESHEANDTTSQAAPRGIRAGGEIGNEYLGVIASAAGIAEHVVWRYGDPQLRPTLTIHNWFPTQFDLDLYDLISFTSTELGMTARLFEIVGVTHEGRVAATTVQHHVVTYVLQECKVQSNPHWFTLNTSTLAAAGTNILAY